MDVTDRVWIQKGRVQICYGIASRFGVVFNMGFGLGFDIRFGMGLPYEEFRLLQIKTPNREIPTNPETPTKYIIGEDP